MPNRCCHGVVLGAMLIGLLTSPAFAALVSHWTFDDGVGAWATDSAGNYTGALPGGGVTWNAADASKLGASSLALNGANGSYLSVNNGANLNFSGGLTFSAWVYNPNHITGWGGAILGKDTEYNFGIGGGAGSNRLWLGYYNNGWKDLLGYSAWTPDTWYHVAVTMSGNSATGNTIQFYVNGTADASNTNAVSRPTNAKPVLIGLDPNGGNDIYYKGSLDDLAAWDTALSSGQVGTLYGILGANSGALNDYDAGKMNKLFAIYDSGIPESVTSNVGTLTWEKFTGGSGAPGTVTYDNGVYTAWFDSTSGVATLPAASYSYTWKGGSAANAWDHDGNWQQAGFPNSASVEVAFDDTAASTTCDLGGATEMVGKLTLSHSSGMTINGAAAIGLAGSGTIGVTAGEHAIQAPLSLAVNATVNVAPGSSLVLGGEISGGGKSLAKSGGGTLALSGANTFNGEARLQEGTLKLSNALALQNATLNVQNGDSGLLDCSGLTTVTLGGLKGSRGLELSGVAMTVGNNDVSSAYSGVLSGTVNVIKTGAGTLTLSGANTYHGGTVVSAGTLRLAAANSPPVAQYLFSDTAAGDTTVANTGGGGPSMNGDLMSGASIVPGGRDGQNALQLDGTTSGYVDIPSRIADFSGDGNWTLAAWIKTTTAGATILYKGDGTTWINGNSTFYLTNGGTGQPTGGYVGAVRHSGDWVSGNVNVNDGDWHFITITDSRGVKTVYTDGVANSLTQSQFVNADVSSRVHIGYSAAGQNDGQNPFNGMMDSMYVFSRALSADEVLGLMDGTLAQESNVLPPDTAVQLAAGATLDLDGANQTIASLSDHNGAGGTLQLTAGTLTLGGDGSSTTFSGSISGGGNLTKIGSGVLTLGGTDTHTGNATVNGGTIRLGAATALETSTVVIHVTNGLDVNGLDAVLGGLAGTADLDFGTSATLTIGGNYQNTVYRGVLAGGQLIKAGGGTSTLGGASAYGGGTSVNAGTLRFEAGAIPSTGAIAVAGGATVAAAPADFSTLLAKIAPDSSGTAALTGDSAADADMSALANVSLGAAGSVTFAHGLTPSGDTFRLGGGGGTLTFSTALTDDGDTPRGLTAFGSGSGGTLVLTGDNTFSGPTTINAGGALQLGHANAARNSTVTMNADNGLRFAPGITSFTVGALASTGSLTLVDAGNNPVALNVGGNGDSTTLGALSGSGSLTKSGNGTLTLATANTHTGGTYLNAGTLQAASGALGVAGSVTFGGGTLQYAMGNSQDVSGRIKNSTGAVAIDTGGNDVSFAAVVDVSNTGGLSKSGSGTLTLAAQNSYQGDTIVREGTLRLQASATAPLAYTFAAGEAINGGSLSVTTTAIGAPSFDVAGGPKPWLGAVTLNGIDQYLEIVPNGGVLPNLGGEAANSYTIGMWIKTTTQGSEFLYKGDGGWTSRDQSFFLTRGVGTGGGGTGTHVGGVQHGGGWVGGNTNVADGNWNFISIVRNGGVSAFYVNGVADGTATSTSAAVGMGSPEQGTQMIRIGFSSNQGDGARWFNGSISGVYVYDRALTAAEIGTIMTTAPATADLIPPTSDVKIAYGGALDLNGASQTVASLADDAPGDGGTVTNNAPGGSVQLTLNPAQDAVAVFSGTIEDGSGTISLLKTGEGTQVLAGMNVYTGGTTVSAGTLEIGGPDALPAGQALTIGQGGALVLSGGMSASGAAGMAGASPAPVPEPSALVLLLSGAIALWIAGRRRRGT